MRVPARYAVHAAVLAVALAVAFQNVQGASASAAVKEANRLARFFELPDQGLITENVETLHLGTGGNEYASADIDVPKLALATDELETLSLVVSEEQPPTVTATAALAKPSIARTELADRPREEIVYHTVQPGQTISTIAEEYGLNIRTVLNANDLGETSIIKPGATLKILPLNGILHIVREGDTLESIAKKYTASVDKIADFNNIKGGAIKEGQQVIVPGGRRPAPAPKPTTTKIASNTGSSGGAFGPVSESGGDTSTLGSMVWPTTCRNVTQYRSYYHTGIDIACSDGAAIYAADGGTVSFTGWNGGYGYQVKIRQDDGTETAYAHIRPGGILVRNGQRVGRGQQIAEMGTTGYSTGYHVHFEVIVGGGFANPLDYL